MNSQIQNVYTHVPLNKLVKKGDLITIPHKKKEIQVKYLGWSMDGMIHMEHETLGLIYCRKNYFNTTAKVVDEISVAERFLNTL